MAMTLADLKAEVEAWYTPLLGTTFDADGAYPGQCVDLIHRFGIDLQGHGSTWGNGDALADNLIANRGYARVSPSSTWQTGDVVSIWTGYYGGHVYIVLEDLGSRVRYVDMNGVGSADDPAGPVTVRTATKQRVIAVARPPRYVGAKAVTAPVPVVSAVDVITGQNMENAAAIIAGSQASGVPLHIAAAMIEKESRGRNVYGGDAGGIFSPRPNPVTVDGTTYTDPARVPVTRDNYLRFLSLLLETATRAKKPVVISNGVGPAQITFWGYHWDARQAGIDLSDAAQNIAFGLRILAGHLAGRTDQAGVEAAGTMYNAGTLQNGVNGYGRDLWVKAEAWRVLLAGSVVETPGGGSEIVPDGPGTDPGVRPALPPATGGAVEILPENGDPGARPTLAAHTVAEVTPLPTILPGPLTEDAELVSTPLERVHWRGEWHYPTSWETTWEQGIPGPDQSPWGAGMVAATGEVTLTRPVPLVQRHGWNPWRDNPPVYGEPVLVEVRMDAARPWGRVFTGIVDESHGAVNDIEVSFSVVEDVDAAADAMSSMPKNFRMPSPVNGERYMAMGLHAASVTADAARVGGWRAVPAPDRVASIVSAPMLGTMWPEVGTLIGCRTLVPQSATATAPSDYPTITRTSWGLTVSNVWARYRPVIAPGATGRLDQQKGIRCRVAPVQDGPAFIELWWRTASIMVTVDFRGVTVETQDGYLENGWRNVLYGRTRSLTAEQKASGFDLIVWLTPDRRLAISVDGSVSNHTAFPSYPRECTTSDMSEVRVTARPSDTQIGAVHVYSTPNRDVAAPFSQNLILDVDPEDKLFGTPAIVGTPAMDVLRAQSEALLVTTYLDETARLWSVSRSRMDGRASVRTLTEDDIAVEPAPRWGIGRQSVYSAVEGRWRAPSASQTRMGSAAATDVWESPADTLRPGETAEMVAHPDADVDWIYVDHAPTKISASTVDEINRDVGSVLGGRTRQSDSAGKVEEGTPSVSWFNGEAVRADWKTYPVEVRYTPPETVKALLQLSAMEIEGLSSRYHGVGFLLRARARQMWTDRSTPRPKATGGRGGTYTHDGGWHVQSPAVMDRIITRLAQMYAQPLPSHDQIGLAVPDPTIRRASTITLVLDGITTSHRVVGVRWAGGPGGVSQTLTLRQINP